SEAGWWSGLVLPGKPFGGAPPECAEGDKAGNQVPAADSPLDQAGFLGRGGRLEYLPPRRAAGPWFAPGGQPPGANRLGWLFVATGCSRLTANDKPLTSTTCQGSSHVRRLPSALQESALQVD